MPKMWEVLKASKGLPVDDPIAALWGQKIADGWQWQIIEITSALPMLFISDGAALTGYRIYGTAEGAGVETENLFDKNATYSKESVFLKIDGSLQYLATAKQWTISDYIPVSTGNYTAFGLSKAGSNTYCCIYNSNKEFIRSQHIIANTPVDFTIVSGESFVRLSVRLIEDEINNAMLIAGSTQPSTYIPHGYKLPLTMESGAQSQNIPIYIGDSKLGEEEYVDYGEQKIYKMSEGTLVPTDPPVPLTPVPTYKGENTLTSTETLGEVTVKGKLKEIAGCYVTLADAVLYQDTKARFVLTPSPCDGYTVQAYGIIYDKTGAITNAEEAKSGLVLDGSYTTKISHTTDGTSYKLNITPIDDIRIWAVGYITFTANGVTTTFYTEPKSAKVSELPTE